MQTSVSQSPVKRPLIAIVTDTVAVTDISRGSLLTGPTGGFLAGMIAAAGVSLADCYVTSISKKALPRGSLRDSLYEGGKFKFPRKEMYDAREQILKELAAIQPQIVVALGPDVFHVLTDKLSFDDYRGTLVRHDGLRIIPTFHPNYIIRGNYPSRVVVIADLEKAHRQARKPSEPAKAFNINPTLEECLTFLRSEPPVVAFDIETTENLTKCIGFAWSKYNAISIPLMSGYSHSWPEADERLILEALDKFLRNPNIKKRAQNMSYEITVLGREYGFETVNLDLDTMLAHHLLYPELLKDLGFLSSLHTDHPMYWGDHNESAESNRIYNCYDCIVTWEVGEELEKQLRAGNLWDFYQTHVHQVALAAIRVQGRGVLIDIEAREKLRTSGDAELDAIKQRLQAQLGSDFNPSSPQQISKLVYKTWNLPAQRKRGTKAPTTDSDALKALAKKVPKRAAILNDIIEYREKRTLLSTFVNMRLLDNRAVTSYNVGRTVTGRLASSATIDGFGGNLQNIPRGNFRSIFIADPGKVIIKSDLSQAEYRVLIWKAKIHRVIYRLLNDPTFNIHMWNASENIYRIPREQITEEMYSNAKNGVYGANYNVGAMKISKMYNIPFQTATMIIQRYHEAVPEIRGVYQKDIQNELLATRKLTNPFGRVRVFLDRLDDELFRAAFAHYCQSTVGDLINLALVELDRNEDVEVLLQVHDELVCQTDESNVVKGVEAIRAAMERPISFPGVDQPLVIPCNIKIGRDWHNTMSLDKWLNQ